MKVGTILLCTVLAVPALSASTQAAEYAQTARLGNCVIKPGTTVVKLVECAGQPISRNTDGVDPRSGKFNDVWVYKSNNRTVLVHVTSEVVTKVEVKAE